jgi:hypothetical protein
MTKGEVMAGASWSKSLNSLRALASPTTTTSFANISGSP